MSLQISDHRIRVVGLRKVVALGDGTQGGIHRVSEIGMPRLLQMLNRLRSLLRCQGRDAR